MKPPTDIMISILNEAAMDPFGEDWTLTRCIYPRYQRWMEKRGLIEQRDGKWWMTDAGREWVE